MHESMIIAYRIALLVALRKLQSVLCLALRSENGPRKVKVDEKTRVSDFPVG
jgi:hypothetical protein